MSIAKKLALAAALCISSSAWAFMPAPGIWGIDAENTGAPGRGFQIEAQNDVVFFTYFGYHADGSNAFYYAAGPITNNVFTGDLLDIQGGTALGGTFKPASVNSALGQMTLSFTSGQHGTLTLPGEPPKAVSKIDFGYTKGPDGLLGRWIFNALPAGIGGAAATLNTKLGVSTSTGNGLVSTSNAAFACEYKTSGQFTGMVFCVESPIKVGAFAFTFKFSGDYGTGIFNYFTSTTTLSPEYEMYAQRIATKIGTKTGLNNGTLASEMIYDPARQNLVQQDGVVPSEVTPRSAALLSWINEVRAILPAE